MSAGRDESSGHPGHGQLGYVQLPAADITRAARFYTSIFGWRTAPPASGFEAPGLIGQWVEDRPVAPVDAGPMLWLVVDDIDETLRQVPENGGEVLEPPSLDGGERWLATVKDSAGNSIGLVQLGSRRMPSRVGAAAPPVTAPAVRPD